MIGVGRVVRAHGLRGEVVISTPSSDYSWARAMRPVSLVWDDPVNPVPARSIRLESVRPHGKDLLAQVTGVVSRESAEALRGSVICIPRDQLVSEPGEEIFLHELKGFGVFDGSREIGVIETFSTNGPQDILRVRRPNGDLCDVLLIRNFLREIDFAKRQVRMELPVGMVPE
jgi:16S rRNA processing protein RimM